MDRILLKNGWRVKHFKYTGNGSPVYFNGINLLVFRVKVNKVFCQCDIGKVSGWNAFVIGPLGKGFPLGIVDVGSAAMSTTVTEKSCCFKMSLIMSMRLDLIGEAPCETGAVACWARTGKEPRQSAECEDVGWVVVVGVATDETGSGKLSESLWWHESPLFSRGSWGRWEPEGRRTLDLSRPMIYGEGVDRPSSVVRVGWNVNWSHPVLCRGEHVH